MASIPEELSPMLCVGRRDWTVDSGAPFDPLSVLMLQQMIADSYTDARDIWEKNRDRVREEGDDPGLYGPNEAQRKIEEWLIRTRFLPGVVSKRPKVREPELTTPAKVEVAPRPSNRIRCLQMIARRGFKSSKKTSKDGPTSTFAMLWTFLQKRLRVADKRPRTVKHNLRPVKQETSEVAPNPKLPSTKTVALRKPRPAFPRIIPSTKPLLRRMTSADSRALISSSVRKRRIPRILVVDSVTPLIEPKNFLDVCTRQRGVFDHSDIPLGSDSSYSSTITNQPVGDVHGKSRRPPPVYITLLLVCLFQCCMLLIMVTVLFLSILKLLAIPLGFLLCWCSEDE